MRRLFTRLNIRRLTIVGALLVWAGAAAAPPEARLTAPKSGPVKVAFVVSDGATLIDIAGPMQVFEEIPAPGAPFLTFTVSQSRDPIKAGSLTIVTDYTFDNAPPPEIVVVGAQSGNSPPYLDYLRRMAARGSLILSVCTGVTKLARAGLLDGLAATSHHDDIEMLRQMFPRVHFLPDQAWVHSAPNVYTAGGETSGIELALHIVELYYGRPVAVSTARAMDYRGPDWQPAMPTSQPRRAP
jgi:transcriptional regulator GlxA family with amidase domain